MKPVHNFMYILFSIFFLLSISQKTAAQLISLKTAPVATGDQFLIFPSQNLGMGAVSIALDDPFLDPFVNPAKGNQVHSLMFSGSPTIYKISEHNGSAQSLPFGLFWRGEKYFGGVYGVLQQVQKADPPGNIIPFAFNNNSAPTLLNDRNSTNSYLYAQMGKHLDKSGLSIAGSMFWADLNAVEGVELLYANSQKIKQSGYILDYRLGISGKIKGDADFELLLLHNRFRMTHDVFYPVWLNDSLAGGQNFILEDVRNYDRSNTWGIHLGYVKPLKEKGWKIGGIFTTNRKSHPKIPNYELMNIPRDPGNTWAFNLGLGLSNQDGATTFGVDLVYEPIWSNTWANAVSPILSASGKNIPAGSKTVDNEFQFSNWKFAIGVSSQEKILGFQLGLNVHWYQYWLDQVNFVEELSRSAQESWAEWRPSIGLSLNFPELQIRYAGVLTTGTGQPGVERNVNPGTFDGATFAAGSDFIIAPNGSLTLQSMLVFTHQISLSIPIRE